MGLSVTSLESLKRFIEEAKRRYRAASSDSDKDSTPDAEIPWPDGEEQFAYSQNLSPEWDTAWTEAAEVFRSGSIVKGIVTGWNRGGLLIRWGTLQGFVPASQLKDVTICETDEERDARLARWVGEELDLKVIELDRGRNRLVFSERATVWGPKDGERLLSEIAPGETRNGVVSNLCDFGAFVDLGGVDGLIHLSELSWRRVNHPRELLSIGDPVQVYVISVDQESRRVALSLKRLRANPWTLVDEKYEVGQTITATVTNVVEFGAFAQIEEGLEGLVHISELSDTKVVDPSEIVTPGDHVQVRIIRIDSVNRRLGLSMRQAQPPDTELAESDLEDATHFFF